MGEIKSQFLGPFLTWYREQGWPVAEVLEHVGLSMDVVGRSEVFLPHATYCAVLEGAERAAGEDALGLVFAQSAQRVFPFLESVWLNSPTVGRAMDTVEMYGPVMGGRMRYSRKDDDACVTITQTCPDAPLRHERLANEFMMAWFVVQSRRMVREELVPVEVAFAHPEPFDINPYMDLFCTPHILFGEEGNRVVWDREVLDLPVVSADAFLYDALIEKVRSLPTGARDGDFLGLLRRELDSAIDGGHPSIEKVANSLGTSGRSLQRKLLDAGSTFRSEVDAARRDRSAELLGHHTVREVALRLGYNDDTAFIRAFRRWTGMAPGEYLAAMKSK